MADTDCGSGMIAGDEVGGNLSLLEAYIPGPLNRTANIMDRDRLIT